MSALSIGGLIKHATGAERSWMSDVVQAPREGFDESKYDDGFTMGPDETLQDLINDSERCGRETEAIIAGIADLSQAVPVPKDVPWFTADLCRSSPLGGSLPNRSRTTGSRGW